MSGKTHILTLNYDCGVFHFILCLLVLQNVRMWEILDAQQQQMVFGTSNNCLNIYLVMHHSLRLLVFTALVISFLDILYSSEINNDWNSSHMNRLTKRSFYWYTSNTINRFYCFDSNSNRWISKRLSYRYIV